MNHSHPGKDAKTMAKLPSLEPIGQKKGLWEISIMGNKILIGGWYHPLIYSNQSNHFFTALEGSVGVVTLHQDTVLPCWSQERSPERCPAEFFSPIRSIDVIEVAVENQATFDDPLKVTRKTTLAKLILLGFVHPSDFLCWGFNLHMKKIYSSNCLPQDKEPHIPSTQAVRIFGEIFQCRLLPCFSWVVSWMEKNVNSLRVYSTFSNSHLWGGLSEFTPTFLGWKQTPWHQVDDLHPKNLKGRSFSGPFPNHPDVSTTHVTNRLERFTNLRFKSYQMGLPLNTPSILVNYNT